MATKKISNAASESKLSASEEEMLDKVSRNIGKRQAPARKKEPPRAARTSRAAEKATPKPVSEQDPWGELEGELSRRIEEKVPAKSGPSVGTRLLEKAKAAPAAPPLPPKEIAKQEVKDLREISERLDEKIAESGLHVVGVIEKNVNAVLGIDVDEAELPRDAEQLLILSVRLMRAAKGFTLGKKLREAIFCYEKALVLFDRILEIDPNRDVTRDMKHLVPRLIAILEKRL